MQEPLEGCFSIKIILMVVVVVVVVMMMMEIKKTKNKIKNLKKKLT